MWFFDTVSQAEILGNPELHLKSGSDINLTCIVRQTPEPPTYIYWYHGRRVINYSQRGGKFWFYYVKKIISMRNPQSSHVVQTTYNCNRGKFEKIHCTYYIM